jgi:hypothetical protein
MPGHTNATMPAAMPSSPITTSHQVGTGLALPVKAAARESTPSISAKAPYNSTRVRRVRPGQIKASMPKTMPAIPRNNSSHQPLAKACSIGRCGNAGVVSRAVCMMLSSCEARNGLYRFSA